MGDLILAPVVDATVSRVIDAASEQLNLALGWKEDLKRFCLILKMLRSVLQDADEKNVINNNSHLKSWLLELRAVADEADDILEEVAYENLRRQLADKKPKWKKVSYFFTQSNPLASRLRMANKVKGLIVYLTDINDWATRLGLQYRLASMVLEPKADSQQTNSSLASQVVGREEDVSKIESLLISDSTSQQGLPVVAIVGMPGLGKTTLAKAVSKSDKIRERFGKNVLWVSVSRNFEPVEILKKMLESAGKSVNVSGEEAAVKELEAALGENRYLLILDDVWNEERQKWESLRNCLLGVSKSKGNRVLVTTRNNDVALLMALTKEHILSPKGLEDHDCWTIIKQRAFGSSSVPQEFSELEGVGVEISKKCQGIPLVASLTGATLQNKRGKREWQSVLKNQVWHSLRKKNGILDIIRVSYDRLPELALKQCFVFCSIFPKASVMEKEMLIQLWMALGFLQSSEDCSMEMEDVGDKYYRCLLSYSLFQEEKRDSFGRVSACKIHDLIHDFAESISSFETMIFKDNSRNSISSHVRHLNAICGRGMMPTSLESVAPKLQTLFAKHDLSNGVRGDLKRLRILSLCDADDVEQLDSCFGNSKSLRYLDISGTKIKELPKFVKKLYNLQTFKLLNCNYLKMPLEGICNLINLRHIYFNDEERMPANLGRLINLQTLKFFFVGTTKGRKIEELGSLSRLKGRLEIRKLELVKGKSEAKGAKLHEKALDELVLIWSYWREEGDCDEDVLEGLQPHSDLQKLAIQCFGGESLPSWMLKSGCGFQFSYLVELRIDYCQKLKSIPVMTGFPSLQLLYVEQCDGLIDGAFAFPSLKGLGIIFCSILESFSNNGLPSLEKLIISYCGVARIIGDSLSTCPRLKLLELRSCPNLQSFPSLYGLSSLQILKICEIKELVHLPSGLSSCTTLKVLVLQSCDKLVSVSEELKELRSLVDLDISYCPELSNFPTESLSYLGNLKKLRIGGLSNELEFPDLGSLNNLHASLEELKLHRWKNLKQLPHQIQAFTALKILWIEEFSGLESLPEWLGNFSSLVELYITDCPNLRSFSEQSLDRLTCLKTLVMGPFAEDLGEFMGLPSIHHSMTSLKELSLYGWEKLTELPHQIQHLTALEDLHILDFTGLEALPDWLGDLSSLQRLSICRCRNPEHLPSAQVIVRLSQLNYLYIYPDWPELKEKIQQVKESTSQSP